MIYKFENFELDIDRYELRENGVPVAIQPQVFAMLALLVANRERMVSKEEMIEKIWNGRIISEAALSSRVKSARQALGDDGKTQRLIRTVHGRGFRFVGELDTANEAARNNLGELSPGTDSTGESAVFQACDRGATVPQSVRRSGSGLFL